MNYKIVSRKDRFIIVDEQYKLVEDANGHGFKSKPAAYKYIWFLNNKDDLEKRKVIAEEFITNNPKIKDYADIFDLDNILEQTKLDPSYNPWKFMLAKVKKENKELYAKLCNNLKIKNSIKKILMDSAGFI